MSAAQVFIVDDQEAVRDALTEMLSVFGFSAQAFASAEEFLDRLKTSGGRLSGCIISDVRMPGMDGIALVRSLKEMGVNLPVILISGHADVPMAVAGIKAGAADFIEKPLDDAQLVATINRTILPHAQEAREVQKRQDLVDRFERLTGRQREVFDLVAEGLTSQAIGEKLGLSVRTVESYRAQIMQKMGAESVAILVRQAISLGRAPADPV